MKLKEYFRQLKIDLEPMTFGEKVDHIWTYNKELIIIVAVLAFLVIGLLVAFLTKPDVMFCGFVVNTELSEDGTAYLTDDYLGVLGGTGKQEVQLISGIYNTTLNSAAETSKATRDQIVAYCSDASLDYIMGDKVAMEMMLDPDICIDLRTFFTEAELAQWQDKLLITTLQDGSEVAYAVNISDTDFAKDCVTNRKELYICFINNTKYLDRCHEFWNYILNWK
ncbi:MAG: hypothetical protein E7448_01935 [Ruminococcaceae bacterium]|nr:hypothetical protein [Oscillospiraceae bacterium]